MHHTHEPLLAKTQAVWLRLPFLFNSPAECAGDWYTNDTARLGWAMVGADQVMQERYHRSSTEEEVRLLTGVAWCEPSASIRCPADISAARLL
jgi:hypothetical protein